MKWKISTFLLVGLTIILCLYLFRQRQEIYKLNEQATVIGRTDTVYRNHFQPTVQYKTITVPKFVYLYGDQWKSQPSTDSPIGYNDSLVQILLSKENLNLSFFNKGNEGFLTKEYSLDLSQYKYNWVNGNLSQQKIKQKPKLIPFCYVQYRPFHKMTDLGFGLNLNTQRFQYKLGINGYYYPCLENKLGTDLEFSITYNLSK